MRTPELIEEEVSQIKVPDEESLERGVQSKNENTTFLLNKMYS